jgi:DNA polymerase-3 subunit epsilon/ATP-dependent DNA helicase DinG
LSINELIEKSGNPDSIMGTSIKILRPIVNINELDLVDAISEDISTTLDKLKINTITLFDLTISEPNQNEFPDSYRQIRITDQIRTNNWHSLEQVTENILLQINTIINDITSFNRIVESRSNQSIMLNIYNDLSALKNDLYEISEKLNEFIFEPDKDAVYWIEKDQKNSKLTFCMAPIEVSQILHEKLFSDKNAVVLTSATLSANQSFEHIKSRLGFLTDNAEIYDSPFDYIDSTFMLMPKSIPDPREEAHIDHVCQSIAMACISMQGRALALFTSYSSIRKAYENLKPVMEKRNIEVLAQGISGSPKQLVNHLRENPHTLLLGTSSMWEGIDIKGESLQVLIMTRLPFAVPTDPIYQARSEKYKNPFMEFAIPTAILKFRQGFGRLIRSNNDRGVFIMLDNRINTKKYGEMFLNSLPAMKRQKYDNNQITNMIKKWLV